ncbi:hypothetical protein SKAU_G00163000 [Synaphobranchus kaupii]|uniref:Uncharacterized protein n=1 Tax=Synaphobranchus kaupii TaxID=118154 RepID=A0A9Q1IZY4_SYNKA|nr:hypothetical protein SKAU_G00163000 [Synaphobranchus kaupii]
MFKVKCVCDCVSVSLSAGAPARACLSVRRVCGSVGVQRDGEFLLEKPFLQASGEMERKALECRSHRDDGILSVCSGTGPCSEY